MQNEMMKQLSAVLEVATVMLGGFRQGRTESYIKKPANARSSTVNYLKSKALALSVVTLMFGTTIQTALAALPPPRDWGRNDYYNAVELLAWTGVSQWQSAIGSSTPFAEIYGAFSAVGAAFEPALKKHIQNRMTEAYLDDDTARFNRLQALLCAVNGNPGPMNELKRGGHRPARRALRRNVSYAASYYNQAVRASASVNSGGSWTASNGWSGQLEIVGGNGVRTTLKDSKGKSRGVDTGTYFLMDGQIWKIEWNNGQKWIAR